MTDRESMTMSRDAAPGNAPEVALGIALRNYALAELDAAIARLGWRGGRLHAGVHLARKALRRTRATLSLGAGVLGPGARLIDRELRKLNRGLSALRDVQALVETLDREIANEDEAASRPLLVRARRVAAAARAGAARAALRADPALANRRALLAALRAALTGLPWRDLYEAAAHDALVQAAQRIALAAARARETGSDDDWHRWRRRARRHSQQRRALTAAGAIPEDAPAFDKHMTERLGRLQDLALLADHCGRGSPFAKRERALLRDHARTRLDRLRAHRD